MGMIEIATLEGSSAFNAYVAEPAGEARAAIVVIQEIFGVNAESGPSAIAGRSSAISRLRRTCSGGWSRAWSWTRTCRRSSAGRCSDGQVRQDAGRARHRASIGRRVSGWGRRKGRMRRLLPRRAGSLHDVKPNGCRRERRLYPVGLDSLLQRGGDREAADGSTLRAGPFRGAGYSACDA
jgi:hypothetical protein